MKIIKTTTYNRNKQTIELKPANIIMYPFKIVLVRRKDLNKDYGHYGSWYGDIEMLTKDSRVSVNMRETNKFIDEGKQATEIFEALNPEINVYALETKEIVEKYEI